MKADPSQDKYFYVVGWCMLGALAIFLIVLAVLHQDLVGFLPPCAFHLITGFYCPGCGGTRALKLLLQGHIIRSFLCHPFVPYVAVFGGWFMLSQTIERLSRHRLAIGMHYRNLYLWIMLVLIFGNWIVKNLILLITGVAVLG